MKKLLALLICIVLSLTFSACGNNTAKTSSGGNNDNVSSESNNNDSGKKDDESSSENNENTDEKQNNENNESKDNESTGKEDKSESVGQNMTLDEYLDSIQGELEQMNAIVQKNGLNLKVTCKNNSLVYTYIYSFDVGDISSVKEALDASLEDTSSTFESSLNELKKYVPGAESIIIEYINTDGKLILSKEFK